MKRAILLLVAMMTAVLSVAGIALALPSEAPDNTPKVNGPVRGITQFDNNVWVGGNFSRVEQRGGALVDNVANLAVFDADTGQYVDNIAPALGGPGSLVRDVAVYDDNVLIGGTFNGPSGTQKNLVMVDGNTGAVVRWYNSPTLQTVLAAPGLGMVYGGNKSLTAFDAATGQKLWTRAPTTVDPDLRTHSNSPAYRDLELDGQTIWAACICDTADGGPSKALVKLNTEGSRDLLWNPSPIGTASFGISVLERGGTLYLAAGGDDFLAAYDKADGSRDWRRDTNGSVQAVEEMGDYLVIGGHFWEAADAGPDLCGTRANPSNPAVNCQTRLGLAAYTFGGGLDPNWDPQLSGKYDLAWALQPDLLAPNRLYVGGNYTRVNGIPQEFYTRFSPAQP